MWALAETSRSRPSEIVGETDPYAALAIDRACLLAGTYQPKPKPTGPTFRGR